MGQHDSAIQQLEATLSTTTDQIIADALRAQIAALKRKDARLKNGRSLTLHDGTIIRPGDTVWRYERPRREVSRWHDGNEIETIKGELTSLRVRAIHADGRKVSFEGSTEYDYPGTKYRGSKDGALRALLAEAQREYALATKSLELAKSFVLKHGLAVSDEI